MTVECSGCGTCLHMWYIHAHPVDKKHPGSIVGREQYLSLQVSELQPVQEAVQQLVMMCHDSN